MLRINIRGILGRKVPMPKPGLAQTLPVVLKFRPPRPSQSPAYSKSSRLLEPVYALVRNRNRK